MYNTGIQCTVEAKNCADPKLNYSNSQPGSYSYTVNVFNLKKTIKEQNWDVRGICAGEGVRLLRLLPLHALLMPHRFLFYLPTAYLCLVFLFLSTTVKENCMSLSVEALHLGSTTGELSSQQMAGRPAGIAVNHCFSAVTKVPYRYWYQSFKSCPSLRASPRNRTAAQDFSSRHVPVQRRKKSFKGEVKLVTVVCAGVRRRWRDPVPFCADPSSCTRQARG